MLSSLQASTLQPRGTQGPDILSNDVEVSVDDTASGRVVTLRIEGSLDEETAATVIEVARAIVLEGVDRLDLDLRDLAAFTLAGANALVVCREICTSLPGGLHYRTGSGPGREALLAAYAERG